MLNLAPVERYFLYQNPTMQMLSFLKSSTTLLFIFSLLIFGCHSVKKEEKLDLMSYGIPVKIAAPLDADILNIGKGQLTDLRIYKKPNYDVLVFMGQTYTTDVLKLILDRKREIVANPDFVKIVEEYADGFIYENKNNEGQRYYGFTYIKVMNDKEIRFQIGNGALYTEKQAKDMLATLR